MEDKLAKVRAEIERVMEWEKEQAAHTYGNLCQLHECRADMCDKFLSFIDSMQEEPVSEKLEEAAKRYATEGDEISGLYIIDEEVEAFKAGAKWQREQFEKNRLKHCNSITNEQVELEQGFIDQHLDKYQRMPTFLDAIEYGMRLQKEQIMKEAVDVTITIPYQNGYGGYSQIVDSKEALPFGEKVKVIVIKED